MQYENQLALQTLEYFLGGVGHSDMLLEVAFGFRFECTFVTSKSAFLAILVLRIDMAFKCCFVLHNFSTVIA